MQESQQAIGYSTYGEKFSATELLLLLEAIKRTNAEEQQAFDAEVNRAKEEIGREVTSLKWIVGIISAIITIITLLSGWLGLPQLRDYMLRQIDERYVDIKIRQKLNEVENRLASADNETKILTLRLMAMGGNINAYEELKTQAKTNETAKQIVSEIDIQQIVEIPDFTSESCMIDLALRCRPLKLTYSELKEQLRKTNLQFGERQNVMKNLARKCENPMECAELLYNVVVKPTTLIDRRTAISCLVYLSSMEEHKFSLRLDPTMDVSEVSRWWDKVRQSRGLK